MFPDRECTVCNKTFKPSSGHKKCPICRSREKTYKCKLCGVEKYSKNLLCKNCFNLHGQTQEANHNWKGGKAYTKKGYVMRQAPSHPRRYGKRSPYVFEHILVMEEHIGRFLYQNETVHHKNGVKNDNRIENLELWTNNHPAGQRVEDIIKWAKEILAQYEPEALRVE